MEINQATGTQATEANQQQPQAAEQPQQPANAAPQENAAQQQPATRESFAFDRKYFGPGEREEAAKLVQRLVDGADPANPNGLRANVTKESPAGDAINVVMYGYKGGKKVADWPADAGIQVLPLSRNKKKTVTVDGKATEVSERTHYGVLVTPYYPLAAIMAAQGGPEYIADLWTSAQADLTLQPLRGPKVALEMLGQMQKVKRADGSEEMVPFELGDVLDAIPTTVANYLAIGQTERGVMKAFNQLGPDLLDQLKKTYKSLAPINKDVFKELLRVKATALQMYEKLENAGLFVKLLDILGNAAVQKGLSREIFDQWKAERDTATVASDEPEDVDAALAGLSIG